MESILLAVVVGIVAIVCSSMVYVLLWKVFKTYFVKYMDRYFDYNKVTYEFGVKVMGSMVEKLIGTMETIYREENNLPIKEETVKEESK